MADFPNLSRRGFLNRSAAVGGLLVVPGLLSACSKTDSGSTDGEGALDKLRKQGFVRVAYANEAPYGYMEGKDLKGEAPTLHREIFKALGVDELKPTLSEWDGLIPGLQAGKYDVVSAGMAITPERCANALFSDPEFISPTAMMVKKGNPKKITDLASAKAAGAVIGVMSGAVEDSYAKGAGISGSKIKTLQKPQDGADAVKAHRHLAALARQDQPGDRGHRGVRTGTGRAAAVLPGRRGVPQGQRGPAGLLQPRAQEDHRGQVPLRGPPGGLRLRRHGDPAGHAEDRRPVQGLTGANHTL